MRKNNKKLIKKETKLNKFKLKKRKKLMNGMRKINIQKEENLRKKNRLKRNPKKDKKKKKIDWGSSTNCIIRGIKSISKKCFRWVEIKSKN